VAGRVVARDYGWFLTTDIARGSPPNPRMQPTGRTVPGSARALTPMATSGT